MNETRIVVCLYVIILWICQGEACSSSWVSSGTNCYYISEDSKTDSMSEAQTWCQSQDATLLIHWDELPGADKRAVRNHMTPGEPYWIGIRKKSWDTPYFWVDGTVFDSALFDGSDKGYCAALTRSGKSLRLRKKKCNIDEGPAQAKFICQRANCPNSAGWYSLFDICVWVSTRQKSTYRTCEEIGARLLRWQDLDAGKKFLLAPPLVADQSWWYTVDGGDCCCSLFGWYCNSHCTWAVARVSSWGDGHCNSSHPDFICESDPASIRPPAPLTSPITTFPKTIFTPRTTKSVTTTTTTPKTTPAPAPKIIPKTTSTPTTTSTSTHPPSSEGSSSEVLPSTTVVQSTRSTSLTTEITTRTQGINASESGTFVPQVSDDNPTVAYDAGGGVAGLVVLVAVAAAVAVMLYRRRRARKDALRKSSSAAAFHNAAYVDPATVISSDPRHGSDPGKGVYSLATRSLPEQPIGTRGGGGDGNTSDNINGSLFNGDAVASNRHVVSSSSAGYGLVDNAVYSTVNKDKSKEQGSPALNGSDAQGVAKEDNVVYSSVDKDKAKKGHNRNTTKSADKSFYRPDSTEMVMSENTDYVSGDDSGISTSEADYSEVKGSGRNMAELAHIEHPKSSNTRPDSTELLMSENTLYGDGSRNDGNDPVDTDYYNVRGTEKNLDCQTNQPATKSADRPDENEYYNVTDFQSHNANSDIGPQCRESFGLTLEENDVYCSGN